MFTVHIPMTSVGTGEIRVAQMTPCLPSVSYPLEQVKVARLTWKNGCNAQAYLNWPTSSGQEFSKHRQ
jgi:hypothetical protein